MTLMTRAALLDKYGFRLDMKQLAEVLAVSPGYLANMLARKGECPIRTYKEGARRFASYEAVAEYLEKMDDDARSGA